MPTLEDRVAELERKSAALEQTAVTRTEFTKAINGLSWQQAQTLRGIHQLLTNTQHYSSKF